MKVKFKNNKNNRNNNLKNNKNSNLKKKKQFLTLGLVKKKLLITKLVLWLNKINKFNLIKFQI